MKKILTEFEAEKFLNKKGIPIAKSEIFNNFSRALNHAKKIKFPIVMKIISKKLLHKTESNAVKIVDNEQDFKKTWNDFESILKKKRINQKNFLIQEYIKGQQIIIGIKKDPVFDHVIMLGLGGIFVEVLKDVSFRMCPIESKDVDSMINDLKAKKLFYGFRGNKINLNLLKELVVKVSKIPLNHPEIKELDINPLIINSRNGFVVDARIVLE